MRIAIPPMGEDARLALAAALLDQSLSKAVRHDHPGEGPDPRYPELNALVERARKLWSAWANWAADRVLSAMRSRSPVDPALTRELRAILDQHEAGVTAAVTGYSRSPDTVGVLVDRGLLDADHRDTAPVPAAVRLGLSGDPHQPKLPGPQAGPATVYLPAQAAAVDYARQRAGVYMRRPIATLQQRVERTAQDAGVRLDLERATELEAVRGTVSEAITSGASVAETARRLREVTESDADMDRVARTELHWAHAFGHYVTLKAQAGPDARVYKIVSPGACSQCRRIWGHPDNPKHYPLAEVEAHDRAGGNRGMKAAEWGPTIGPTHPNCTCPPLQIWNPEMHDAVTDVAAMMRDIYGV